ncbi:hypothetical protein NHF40_13830 [Maricaulaceae bacterium EIL42A08]|nr:hypothetical protein [Maricaulaceae bacterium EIL42A08]
MKSWIATALATGCVFALTTSADAQQRIRDGQGGVVFSYEQPNFGDWRPLTTFMFAEVDPETGELVERGETQRYTPQARDWPLAGTRIDAGSYVLREIYLYAGASSAYCFADRTVRVDVEPGEVVYLGHLTFQPAGTPEGLVNQALGNRGTWRGELIRTEGNRAAAEAQIGELFRDVEGFSADEPGYASFTIDGLGRRQIGRDCSNAEIY